jgi:hypothetical protein
MQAKHIAVLVIGMPSQDCNRALLPESFWTQFRGFISTNCNQYGATFCDLTGSNKFVKRDFLDTVHLNAYGGDKFFAIIADEIAGKPQIVSALKPVAENAQIAGKEPQATDSAVHAGEGDETKAQASAPAGIWR